MLIRIRPQTEDEQVLSQWSISRYPTVHPTLIYRFIHQKLLDFKHKQIRKKNLHRAFQMQKSIIQFQFLCGTISTNTWPFENGRLKCEWQLCMLKACLHFRHKNSWYIAGTYCIGRQTDFLPLEEGITLGLDLNKLKSLFVYFWCQV